MAALAEETFSALASEVDLLDLPLLDADLLLLDADLALLADALLILCPFDDDGSESENDLYDLVLMTVFLADFPVDGEVALPWMDLPALDGTGRDMECDRIGADLLLFAECPGFFVASVVVAGSVAPVVVGGLMDSHSQTVLINCGSTAH